MLCIVAQWLVHLPLMLNVLGLNKGSGAGISVSKHVLLLSFARMTLKNELISGFR